MSVKKPHKVKVPYLYTKDSMRAHKKKIFNNRLMDNRIKQPLN